MHLALNLSEQFAEPFANLILGVFHAHLTAFDANAVICAFRQIGRMRPMFSLCRWLGNIYIPSWINVGLMGQTKWAFVPPVAVLTATFFLFPCASWGHVLGGGCFWLARFPIFKERDGFYEMPIFVFRVPSSRGFKVSSVRINGLSDSQLEAYTPSCVYARARHTYSGLPFPVFHCTSYLSRQLKHKIYRDLRQSHGQLSPAGNSSHSKLKRQLKVKLCTIVQTFKRGIFIT